MDSSLNHVSMSLFQLWSDPTHMHANRPNVQVHPGFSQMMK